jgi:hypothetical protein
MEATDGITTVIDTNDYNLSLKEAVANLKSKRPIIAVEYPDYSQEHLSSVYQEPVVLTWQDYFDQEDEEIIESLRQYEQFGIYE